MPLPRSAFTLLLTLLLAACSRLDLVYQNLDRLMLWWIDDYLNLDSVQKSWLQPRLQAELQWHCRSQLPSYVAWQAELQRLLAQQPLQAAQIEAQFAAINSAQQTIAAHTAPVATELLRGLSPRQIAALRSRLTEEQEKLAEEYLALPPDKQIATRAERMEKRLRPWLGRLNPAQQARVQGWAKQMHGYDRLWLDNRQHWQQELLATLEVRHSADFQPRLTRLLQQRKSLWSPTYRQAFRTGQQAFAELLADLLNGASAQQREHLLSRLDELRENLAELDCQG
ncbi:hypothetical protein D3880_16870 [Pseudomonas cavernae]|uniref:Lipoprotein n=1 Tax=Pseudomonas cavernae TaxID=2320867 RepID=A0A385Z5Z4_9PSED|nr:DUF6279 family lipoprotein [Pseudomonas cavernae]AYC33930.1 hypothetical protein D3880_16870 [Pseudomonas cavernae]